ncbi:hypothetical protein SAMN06272735_0184 [Streptomyces sp. TLI_55]|nr:hypothetical protein SAMN06272735_0184 [Streptomyces sp. TLI_55]
MACWCDTEHATHDIDAVRVVVDDETSMGLAYESFAGEAGRLTTLLKLMDIARTDPAHTSPELIDKRCRPST